MQAQQQQWEQAQARRDLDELDRELRALERQQPRPVRPELSREEMVRCEDELYLTLWACAYTDAEWPSWEYLEETRQAWCRVAVHLQCSRADALRRERVEAVAGLLGAAYRRFGVSSA